MTRTLPALLAASLFLAAFPVAGQAPVAEPGETGGDDTQRPAYADAARPCADAKNFRDPDFRAPEASQDYAGQEGAQPGGQAIAQPPAGAPRSGVAADLDGDERTDSLDFFFDSQAGYVLLRYDSAAGTPQTMALQFGGVFEFRDLDGDGRHDEGEPVLQEFRLLPNRLHYADWWHGPCGARILWTYFLTATMEEIDGQIEADDEAALAAQPRMALRFTHLQQQTVQDGVTLRPDRVKADITVDHFPFSETGTRVAVRSWVAAGDSVRPGGEEPEVRGEDGQLVYRWLTEAVADGGVVPVATSLFEVHAPTPQLAGDALQVTFAYPRAASILHDPELGLHDVVSRIVEAIRKGDPVAYGVGAVVGVALLAVMGLTRRRP